MIYEAKVNDLADEFGVHRNTIRNWINSGVLPAQEGPGRRYLIQWEDYKRLCDKYGREPRIAPDPTVIGDGAPAPRTNGAAPTAVRLEAKVNPLYTAPALADVCLTCGSCAGACPISGVDDLDPRKIIRMAFLGMDEELVESDWPVEMHHVRQVRGGLPDERRDFAADAAHPLPPRPRQGAAGDPERGGHLSGKGQQSWHSQGRFSAPAQRIGRRAGRFLLPRFCDPDRRARRPDPGDRQLQATLCRARQPHLVVEDIPRRRRILDHLLRILERASTGGCTPAITAPCAPLSRRIIDNIERLNCKALLLPECGHAYYATRYALERWFPEALQQFKVYTVFDLLLEYLAEGRITLGLKPAHPADHLPRLLQLWPQFPQNLWSRLL